MKPKSLAKARPLPTWARFYLYGMHGLLDEIVFTALFDAMLEPAGNRQLKGYTTIFTFFIYGSCAIFVERLYLYLYVQNGVQWYFRFPVYFVILYTWELVSGLILRQFDACSWDYSHYPLNFMGLITLVYAPFWAIIIVYQDWLSDFMLSLRITTNGYHETQELKES